MASDSGVFDEEFFDNLKKIMSDIWEFFQKNWFWGIWFFVIIIVAVIIQQIILTLFFSFL